MNKKSFFKGLLHMFVSTAAVAGANILMTGAPITSGNVLIPAVLAGGLAVGHAAFPSIIGAGQTNTNANDATPPSAVSNFPTTR